MKMLIKEDPNCYVSLEQQQLLHELAGIQLIKENFFLTGGTALSVFYLHHRTSEDIDFFTKNDVDLGILDQILKRIYKDEISLVQSAPMFLSYLIKNIKVDIVIDPLTEGYERDNITLKIGNRINIDTIDNISSNKLTTMVSRFEIKDLVDFYCISKEAWKFSEAMFMDCFKKARKKEALLDDPAAAAYQIEQTLEFSQAIIDNFKPMMKKPIEWVELESTIKKYIQIIYNFQEWR